MKQLVYNLYKLMDEAPRQPAGQYLDHWVRPLHARAPINLGHNFIRYYNYLNMEKIGKVIYSIHHMLFSSILTA